MRNGSVYFLHVLPRFVDVCQARNKINFLGTAYSSGITVFYQGGDFCAGTGQYRETYINVGCDPDAKEGQLFAESSVGCTYYLE